MNIPRIKYGPHKGKKITALPESELRRLIEKSPALKKWALAELTGRISRKKWADNNARDLAI